jgi:hypothetical protein
VEAPFSAPFPVHPIAARLLALLTLARYIAPAAASRGVLVLRKFLVPVVLAAAFGLLSGCDKCSYELQDIRLPMPPHACSR